MLSEVCYNHVYIAIEGIEKGLGFDPNDSIVPFVLFAGTSATLWYECPFFFFLLSLYISYFV